MRVIVPAAFRVMLAHKASLPARHWSRVSCGVSDVMIPDTLIE